MRARDGRTTRLTAVCAAGLMLTGCSSLAGHSGWLSGVDTSLPLLEQSTPIAPDDTAAATTLLSSVYRKYKEREQSAAQLSTDSLVPLAVGAAAAIGAAFFIKGPAQTNSLK